MLLDIKVNKEIGVVMYGLTSYILCVHIEYEIWASD